MFLENQFITIVDCFASNDISNIYICSCRLPNVFDSGIQISMRFNLNIYKPKHKTGLDFYQFHRLVCAWNIWFAISFFLFLLFSFFVLCFFFCFCFCLYSWRIVNLLNDYILVIGLDDEGERTEHGHGTVLYFLEMMEIKSLIWRSSWSECAKT